MNHSERTELEGDPVIEELTAYLDGELEADAARRVEERLARDESYRQQLHGLQRTWDMLDELPQSRVDESFLRSTIEMVAQAAEQEVKTSQRKIPRRRNTRRLAAAAGFLAALSFGFLIGGYLWPDKDRQVLENLPLVDNLDMYQMRHHDAAFAEELLKAGLFVEDREASEEIPSDLQGRRDWVAARPPAKQYEIRQNWERFQSLPAEQQAALKATAAELETSPRPKQLREIESRYRQWYAGLTSEQRDELLNLPVDQRIRLISKMRQPPLTAADLETVARWFNDQVMSREDQLLESLGEKEKEQYRTSGQEAKKFMLHGFARRAWQLRGRDPKLPFKESDYQKLHEQLSPNGQAHLAVAKDRKEKAKLVHDWLRDAIFFAFMLPASTREELRSLSSEEFYERLAEHRSLMWGRGRGGRDDRGPPRFNEERERDGRRRGGDQRDNEEQRRGDRRDRDRDEGPSGRRRGPERPSTEEKPMT